MRDADGGETERVARLNSRQHMGLRVSQNSF